MAKSATGGKNDSDQASGFAKSFDQYEYVAVITPGAALLFGLYLVLRPNIPFSDLKDIGIGTFGAFLVAAYVIGHILRAVGDVFEELWLIFGGRPSEWVLQENPQKRGLLNAQQLGELVTRVDKLGFEFDTMQLKPKDGYCARRKKFESWQAVTRQIYIDVRKAKNSGRVDVFNRTYGMMVGITVALLIVALLLLVKSYMAGFGWTEATIGCVIALILVGFSLYRTYLFGKLYARELYVSFLDLAKASKR